MGWVAGKVMTIKRKGEYVRVKPGDPIPEAEHWPNRGSWERQKYIRFLNRNTDNLEEVSETLPVTSAIAIKIENIKPIAEPEDKPKKRKRGRKKKIKEGASE